MKTFFVALVFMGFCPLAAVSQIITGDSTQSAATDKAELEHTAPIDEEVEEADEFGVEEKGRHYAAALHLNGTMNRFNLLAGYIYYRYDLPDIPGQPEETVVMGAYDLPYNVAVEASLYLIGLSYSQPVSWGAISSLTFYDNYTYTDKANAAFQDTEQNVLGVLITAGQLYSYFDIASARNHPWLGPYAENWNSRWCGKS